MRSDGETEAGAPLGHQSNTTECSSGICTRDRLAICTRRGTRCVERGRCGPYIVRELLCCTACMYAIDALVFWLRHSATRHCIRMPHPIRRTTPMRC